MINATLHALLMGVKRTLNYISLMGRFQGSSYVMPYGGELYKLKFMRVLVVRQLNFARH